MTDEETKQEEPKEEEASEEIGIVEKAAKVSDVLQGQLDRFELLTKQMKQMETFKILGGRSGGPEQEKPKKELTPKEYKDSIMGGVIPK